MADQNTKDFYIIQVQCANCGKGSQFDTEDYEIAIPKGVMITDFLETCPCDYCGCTALNKLTLYVPERLIAKKDNPAKDDIPSAKGKGEFVSVQDVLGKWEEAKPALNSDEPTQQTFKKKSKQKNRVVKVIR